MLTGVPVMVKGSTASPPSSTLPATTASGFPWWTWLGGGEGGGAERSGKGKTEVKKKRESEWPPLGGRGATEGEQWAKYTYVYVYLSVQR